MFCVSGGLACGKGNLAMEFIYSPEVQCKEALYVVRQKFEALGIYDLTLFLNKRLVAAYRLEVRE